MKRLTFLVVLLLIPVLVFGQARKRYNGKLIHDATINSDAYVDGSIDNEHLSSTAVDGSVMLEATRYMWFPCAADSSANDGWKGSGAWTLDTSNPPTVVELFGTAGTAMFTTYGFEADGSGTDDVAYLTFPCPDDYETDSMELYLYWFHLDDDGAATDTVEWIGALNAVASGEDLMVAGTAITAVQTVCTASDSALYITNLDPEVETITAGDLITVELSCDVSASELDSGENAHLLGIKVTWEAKDD